MEEAVLIIKNGGIAVIPTDTTYGLLGSTFNKKAVERIYKVRKRNTTKPFVVLINDVSDLEKFEVKLAEQDKKILLKYWPGKISFILPCLNKKYLYLHRGTNTIAFRVPKDKKLSIFIKKTGPLVAPSANLEGMPVAENIEEAKRYFNKKVDFYVDGGIIKSVPSTLVELANGKIKILRYGEVKIKEN